MQGACSGVAKSAKCLIIRLCHRICPWNRLRLFALLGASASRIAFTLSESIAIPSLLTTWPSRLPLATLKTHFARFRLSRYSRHFSKHSRRLSRCSVYRLYTTKSFRKTCMNPGIYSPNISMIMRWNVVGTVFSLNIMTIATNTPHSVTKAVFS